MSSTGYMIGSSGKFLKVLKVTLQGLFKALRTR